jgi:hypothetical protein
MDELVPHGIHNECADFRLHVSIRTKAVYLFLTEDARRLIKEGKCVTKFARQLGHIGPTSKGKIIAYSDLPDVRVFPIPEHLLAQYPSVPPKDLDVRGRIAQDIAKAMFPFLKRVELKEDKKGTDYVDGKGQRTQVKCDWNAGPKPGTGNFYIEEEELNPHHLYS